MFYVIGIARRCSGCTCTPQGGEKKFFGRNLQEKFVSATPAYQVHPQGRGRAIFRTFFGDLEVGVVDLVVLDRLSRAMRRKRSTFSGKKCTPRQNPGYACVLCTLLVCEIRT